MKEFPIMTKKGKEYIPYDIIKPHEEQALKQNGWKNQFVQKYEGNHEKGDHVASDCRWCNH